MDRFRRAISILVWFCLTAGIAILLVQAFWTTHGVFVRYVLVSPDRLVTEATALLLVPLAYIGLPYAVRHNLLPKVTFVLDRVPPKVARLMEWANLLIMVAIGMFLSVVAIKATIDTFRSGASSKVLEWPEYLFWAPTALALTVFVLCGCLSLFHPGKSSR